MITRRAPVGAVCLRCRLRLLQHSTPIRYFANDGPSTPRVDDATENAEDSVQDAADQGQKSRPEGRSQTGWKKLNLHNRHMSGNRVLDEAARSLGSDMLGKPAYAIVMKDRGKIKKKQFPSVPGENRSATVPFDNTVASIEALLESQRQREQPSLQEILSIIDDLQPADRALPQKEFRKLQHLLAVGFLSIQLKSYIDWRKPGGRVGSKESIADTPSQPKFSWIKEWTPWVPLPTEANATEQTNFTLQGYISDTTSPKEKLAIRLMRECWGLSILELQTQLGETRIKLHDHEFILLMRGTQRFMSTLGEIWLEPGEKIEAFRKQSTLRLVSTKPKVEAVLRDLDNTLGSVTQKTFPLVLVAPENPDDAILEELGRVTNTYITRSRTARRQLHVAWIEIKSRAAQGFTVLEDMAHIVMRLLLTASGSRRTTHTLLSSTTSQTSPSRLIADVTSKDKLGWKDRLAQWARYAEPLTPERDDAAVVLPIKEFELPFEPLKAPESLKENLEFFPDTKFPFHPVKWSTTLQTSTVARFGQILHPYQPSNVTPSLSDLLLSTDRRVFVPTTPHPLHLTRFDTSDANTTNPLITMKSTIVLHLWPSPSSNPASRSSKKPTSERTSSKPTSERASSKKPKSERASSKKPTSERASPKKPTSKRAGDTPPAPLLEVRLATSENEVQGVESLRAITRTHHTEVMLPSSHVDVRFTQTQYAMLQAPDRETLESWSPLADFLRDARLDLENGKLEMPPRQKFPVPRRLFTAKAPSSPSISSPSPTPTSPPPTSANSPPRTEGTDPTNQPQPQVQLDTPDDSDELESISYEFVGLEFHRSATLPYEGHQLTYTSIEAGQGGGRRAEVTLEPVEHPNSSSTELADKGKQQEDFLACCRKLATDRSLWSGWSDQTQH
ncbi:hypothetical protein F5Y10DRAFT_238643 [Nemania abortiva]|nr:hypothetical protein F5Y10DRAFT_238643 [Nemania abortiva]